MLHASDGEQRHQVRTSTRGRHRAPRRHSVLPSLLVGVTGTLCLALSMNGTMSALTAKISNTATSAGVGDQLLEIYDGSTLTCRSDGTATDVNGYSDGAPNSTNASQCTFPLYGGPMLSLGVNSSASRTLTVKNAGTLRANTMTLTAGACTQSVKDPADYGSATDLCNRLLVTIVSGSKTLVSAKSLSALASGSVNILSALGTTQLAAGDSLPITITVQRPGTVGEDYRNLLASQSLTWKITT